MRMELKYKWFVTSLLDWNRKKNTREMPWKGEKNPYKIWLSEIILQQTRVNQGLSYYNNFIKAFPTIRHLAKAPEEKIFKLWEGLGYYTRCKNLIVTAKYIANELGGKFPDNYSDILKLKGIGPYTAAAISSFAFNLPCAVVDGNVFRVLSRVFGIIIPTDTNDGKKYFSDLAAKLIDPSLPGIYNQALMDFGAVVCKPLSPSCKLCPLKKECFAYNSDKINSLPVKSKMINTRKRWLIYVVAESGRKVLVRKRSGRDIWQSLYEFILIEPQIAKTLKIHQDFALLFRKYYPEIKNYQIMNISPVYSQTLTHQVVSGQFIHIATQNTIDLKGYFHIPINEIKKYPFSKFIHSYLEDKNVSLNLF